MKQTLYKIALGCLTATEKLPVLGGVMARYKAAFQQWGERSQIWSTVQDARLDISQATRTELLRLHRDFLENCPVISRIENLIVQFAVGFSGLVCDPNSSDEDWNEARSKNWETWSRNPETNSRQSMSECEQQWARQLMAGEVFVNKTQRLVGLVPTPAIETIESHRVATPPDKAGEEGKTIFDGIRVNALGLPVSCYVRDAIDQASFKEIPFSKDSLSPGIIHKFKARRPGQLRGIPEGYTGMNINRDYDDLHKLEMQAAKAASKITNVLKNASGEFSTSDKWRGKINLPNQGGAATKNHPLFYQYVDGAVNIALKKGEEFDQFQSNRPSVAMQTFWDLLVTEICIAYNVPKLLVMPFSMQGTVTRADLDVASGAFRANFEIIASIVRETYEWQTAWAVKFDRAMDGKIPKDFLEVFIRPPRAPNVDIGRNSAAMLAELAAGTLTYQDVFAERQQNWRTQFKQAAECAAYLKKLAVQFSTDGIVVTEQDIANKLQQKITLQTPEDAAPATKELETV